MTITQTGRRVALVGLLALIAAVLPLSIASAQDDPAYVDYAINDNVDASDALQTSILLSQTAFPDGTDTVLLTTSEDGADALASGVLANDAALLYYNTDEGVVEAHVDEITRLGADTVIIIGGEARIGQDVVDALEDMGLTVIRLAGDDRITTANEVLAHAQANRDDFNETASHLSRAFGTDDNSETAFADSVGLGAWDAQGGAGTVLAPTDAEVLSETYPTTQYFTDVNTDNETIVPIGGEAAVPADVVDYLTGEPANQTAGDRVFNEDNNNRAGTAVAINDARGLDPADLAGVVVVDGFAEGFFIDAYAAAALAGNNDYAVVLSNGDDLAPESAAYLGSPAFAQNDGTTSVFCTPNVDPAACDATITATGGDPADKVVVALEGEPPVVVPDSDVLIPMTASVANANETQLLVSVMFNNPVSAGGAGGLAWAYGPTDSLDSEFGGFSAVGQPNPSNSNEVFYLFPIVSDLQDKVTGIGIAEGAAETPPPGGNQSAFAYVPLDTAMLDGGDPMLPSGLSSVGPDGVSAGSFDDDSDPAPGGPVTGFDAITIILDEDIDDASTGIPACGVAGPGVLFFEADGSAADSAADGDDLAAGTICTGDTADDNEIVVEFLASNAQFADFRSVFVPAGTLCDDDTFTPTAPNCNYGFSLPLNGGAFQSNVPRLTGFSVDPINDEITASFNQQITFFGAPGQFIFSDYENEKIYAPTVVDPLGNTQLVLSGFGGAPGAGLPAWDNVALTLSSGAVVQASTFTPNVDQSVAPFDQTFDALTYSAGFSTGPLITGVERSATGDIFGTPTGIVFTVLLDQPVDAVAGPVVTIYGPAEEDNDTITCDAVVAGDTELVCEVLASDTNFDTLLEADYLGLPWFTVSGELSGFPNPEDGSFIEDV